MQLFAPAQLVGYLALVLGIAAFLQKKDQRLRFLNATQCLVYAVHFYLLGNAPAAASTSVSSVRSFVSIRYRSRILAVFFVGIILSLGIHFAASPSGWLPIISSCVSTVGMFLFRGVALRLILLGCTLLWLINNVLSGSIGGTILEVLIGTINLSTIVRILLDRSRAAGDPDCCV